ncbi:MAG: DNA primase [Bradyrhizobium sp.]|nr:MAG: DNA primase [Bradyrhizobium sp.]
MKFSAEFLEEIRARIPVSQVVGARVKLRKTGREFSGLSPFNSEKTPSFTVNDQKGFYHDFSSGKHGDIFTFLMETEGLSFPEAVERLAGAAGVAMPARTREGEAREQKRAGLHDVLALAAKAFETTLHEPLGAKARGYLADRRIDPATQRLFGLGYSAPDRFALREALAAKGVDSAQMIEAGLLIHGEDIAVPYDRFRDRVMFPIHDRSGRVVAFGGRAMEAGAKAKYLNSPEGELFHKGGLLYNHHRARKAAHDKSELVVVEGYVDVIAMTQAGFAHTVAPLGTALTPEQCALLWTMAEEPILCFDGDKAGRKAAHRAIDTALPLIAPGKTLRFALLPEGQDPDDLVRSGGAPAIAEALGRARPLADMLFDRETEERAFDTPEKRAALERRLRELIGQIADDTLRRHYGLDMERRLSQFLGLGAPADTRPDRRERSFRGGRRTGFVDPGPRVGIAGQALAAQPRRLASRPREAPRELAILAVLIGHPSLIEPRIEDVAGVEFASPALSAFRDRLLSQPVEAFASAESLADTLAGAGLGPERERILALAAAMANWWCLRAEAEVSDAEHVLRQTLALQRSSGALNRELKLAEQALAADPTEQNLARLLDIKANLVDLADAEAAIEGFGSRSGRGSSPL